MECQTEENLKSIAEASAIKTMISTMGWRILDEIIKERIEQIKLKRDQSDDPYAVMGCVRQEDGIMLIKEVITGLISEGEEAEQLLNPDR